MPSVVQHNPPWRLDAGVRCQRRPCSHPYRSVAHLHTALGLRRQHDGRRRACLGHSRKQRVLAPAAQDHVLLANGMLPCLGS